jgi:hypothetical protein
MNITFSIWDGGTLIQEFQLVRLVNEIQGTIDKVSNTWKGYTVLAEWGDGLTKVSM